MSIVIFGKRLHYTEPFVKYIAINLEIGKGKISTIFDFHSSIHLGTEKIDKIIS